MGTSCPQTPRQFPSPTRRAALVGLGSLALMGHTPYGQWVAYRQKHLLIGCHRQDPASYDLAQQLSQHLLIHLPDSRARVARARAPSRLASLLATDQLDVALLAAETIRDMREARGNLQSYGPIDLRLLANIERHTLVAIHDFPAGHAWLVSAALADIAHLDDPPDIPIHPGSSSFRNGQPKPV